MISALLGPPVRGRRSESMRSDSAEHWTETGGASKVGRRIDYRGRVCPRAEDVDRWGVDGSCMYAPNEAEVGLSARTRL